MNGFLRQTWDIFLRTGAAALGAAQSQWRLPLTRLLLAMMALDYLSGLAAAWLHKSRQTPGGGLSSKAGMRGIGRKLLMLLAVGAAAVVDRLMNNPTPMLQSAASLFYLSNEGLSFLENLVLCGVPIPARLRSALESLGAEARA